MDPEIVERLNEQFREMSEILGEQNSMMAAQMKAMKAQVDSSGKVSKANKEQGESTDANTKKQEAYARAELQRDAAVKQTTDRFNKAMDFTAGAFMSLGAVVMDSTQSFQKYNGIIGSVGDAALDLGRNFGILGSVLGGVVKASTSLIQYQLEQSDNLLKMSDQISKMGAVNQFSTDTLLEMANSVGLTSRELEKLTKPMQSMGTSFTAMGSGIKDSAIKFKELNEVSEETRNLFRRMGYNDEQRIEAFGEFINTMSLAGISVRNMAKDSEGLRKSSQEYIKNLHVLSEITGKSAEEMQKEQQIAAATMEFQLYSNRREEEASRLEAAGDTEGAKAIREEIIQANRAVELARSMEGQAGAAATAQQIMMGFTTLGDVIASRAMTGTQGQMDDLAQRVRNREFDQKAYEDLRDEIAGRKRRFAAEQAVGLSVSEDYRRTAGLNDLDVFRNLTTVRDKEPVAAAAEDSQEALERGEGQSGTDARQDLRDTLVETERSLRTWFDAFAGGMSIAVGGLLGLTAAAAGAALALSRGGGILGRLAGTAASGAMPAGAATAGAGRLATASRFLGKAGALGAVGYGVYEGVSGWSAANREREAGTITEEEANRRKGEAAGSGIGGAGGALAGAKFGAMLGAAAGPLGILAGGLIGGGLGYFGGSRLGRAAGSAVGGMFGDSQEEVQPNQPTTPESLQQPREQSNRENGFDRSVEQFGRFITIFGRLVTSSAKLVTANAKLTKAFATSVKTFRDTVGTIKEPAATNREGETNIITALNNIATLLQERQPRRTSRGLLGTSLDGEEDEELLDYVDRLKNSLKDSSVNLDSMRDAEIRRHAFNEISMRQFRLSIEDLSKSIGDITGIDRTKQDRDRPGSSPGGGGEGAGSSENADKAMQYFMDQGWTRNQAAGIVGNLQQESGANLNPSARNPGDAADGTDSVGIAQWNSSRLRNLERFARERGTSSEDFDTQLAFVQYELTQGEKRNVGRALRRTDDVAEAATLIDRQYEVSDGRSSGQRIANARTLASPRSTEDSDTASGNDRGPTRDELASGIIKAQGKEARVDPRTAPAFQRVLNKMTEVGYRINSLGGQVNRNIAGTNEPSAHSRGWAIDVNPQQNPDTGRGGRLITDMPAEVVAEANRVGLGWGGHWRSKKDAMHYSAQANEGGTLRAAQGGIFDGPTSGYPAELHGGEMVAPLDANSVLMKLAKTPADATQPNALPMPTSIEKETIEKLVTGNQEMLDVMIRKLEDMVSAISDGNDTREKIFKNTVA
jgi:hypothetical protein